MDATMDILPGEGEVRTVIKHYLRRECDVCGEPAHYKHTFLLEGARRNPASKAYGKDDCTWCEDESRFVCWCEDESRFVCKEHMNDRNPSPGTIFCSTFPASERFKHMFLYWKEEK